MATTAPTYAGIKSSDIKNIGDASLEKALRKGLEDKHLDEKDVRRLFDACLKDKEKGKHAKLDTQELKGLWMIADKSKSLSDKARWLLRDLLLQHSNDAMYGPNDIEGFSAPGVNFAGPGFGGKFRLRPTNLFDLAAKIHDVAYQLNGCAIEFNPLTEDRAPTAQSRKAKADYVFRRMSAVSYPNGPSNNKIAMYNFVAKKMFDGKSSREFISGDGYINPLVVSAIKRVLCDPKQCLMYPYSLLPLDKRPTKNGKPDFEKVVPEDQNFWEWFTKAFKNEWTAMTIGSVCATGKLQKQK